MCQIKHEPVKPDLYEYIAPGDLVTVKHEKGLYVYETRTGTHKVQCQHENGEWEDTPELKNEEWLHCEINTKIRLVPL